MQGKRRLTRHREVANMRLLIIEDEARIAEILRSALSRGEVRSAEKRDGRWMANAWVKQGILLGFRLGELAEMESCGSFSFVDKETYPVRHFSVEQRVR